MSDDRRLSPKTQLGLAILGAGVGLGVAFDLLLRPVPNGINVSICVALLVGAALLLARRWVLGVEGGGRWLLPAAVVFGAAFAWRDSPTLRTLNGLALLTVLALAFVRLRAGRVRVAGIIEYGFVGIQAGVGTAFGPLFLTMDDVQWGELPRDRRWYGPVRAIGRGLLIVAPLLLVFGGLFMAADAVFAGLVGGVFAVDGVELMGHLALVAVIGWIVAGLLRVAFFDRDWALRVGPPPGGLTLGAIEVGIILGLLNLLFLAFVGVQVRYLFGGEALVLVSATLTYAEYARRGFFELVTVSALVLPVLLGAHWGLRADDRMATRLFRGLAGTLVVLLFAVMASAVQRMRLYQETYGLTELRLYTTAFMGWLALVFLWFVMTVLWGRRDYFAFGALVSGCVVVAVLNGLNPDALIVRTNAALAKDPIEMRIFDADYGSSLSADAVPALIDALPSLDPIRRRVVANALLRGRIAQEPSDWRNWNYARWAAWEAIEGNRGRLEEFGR